jgi:alanine dehydrogenase
MLALIQECSSEQRRAAADQRAVQTELSVDLLEKQAGEMRAKAVTALVTGVISGALSIGAGIASTTMGSITLKDSFSSKATQAVTMAQNNLTQGVSGLFSSTGQLANTIGQGIVGFKEADIKQLDAQIERIRAATDTIKMLEDSLKELIQKTQSSMDAMQANMNQTRTKILG